MRRNTRLDDAPTSRLDAMDSRLICAALAAVA
jgi:hypothetical protein